MNDVTQILSALEHGDPNAADKLLPLVYDELRKLAAARMAQESPGQTLQATAFVHEAYLRLVAGETERSGWDGRGISSPPPQKRCGAFLVENARRKQRVKHGGGVRPGGIRRVGHGRTASAGRLAGLGCRARQTGDRSTQWRPNWFSCDISLG